jgi:hypothetical protein
MTGTPIDREKLLSLTVGRGRRQSDRRDTVREWRTGDGERHKAHTDELGNTVTQHGRILRPSGDRQDVNINASTIKVTATTEEIR